ncbi:transcriptional regulator [Pseudomonas fluorescens]|uniref:Transcriptional regulator n=1 Tax=Pseudomonas fluorescens TaxID=294 RepID=A0A1T2YPN5_PSEFL|nr:transcriptional regulator [Pseudomonas fluorescens]OPA94131.1 transcriptional regulator [Pseudomonas fluorescens]
MSTLGLPGSDVSRQAFLDSLVSGEAAHQQLCPGIQLCMANAGARQGLCVQIAREALRPGQLQRLLERRFEQAVAFDGCFAYLDNQGALVIWHPLPTQRSALEQTLSRMLSLADLEAFDERLLR